MAETQKIKVIINSIMGGRGSHAYLSNDDQFGDSNAIDPEQSLSGLSQAEGWITPILYRKFSSTNVSGAPKWIITNPKDELIYTYMDDGKFVSYNSVLGNETLIDTIASSDGNGAAYYNNYIYLASRTQIFRYGPLDGTPAVSNALIANGELLDGWDGGADTLLTNSTYPGSGQTSYPNHTMHEHVDGKLYVLDFVNGQGLLHAVITKKTTVEGDTNNSSAYGVLTLPFGHRPTCLASYGNDVGIGSMQISSTSIDLRQGRPALFLWDGVDPAGFYRQVDLDDTIVTAMLNKNGILYLFGGNGQEGLNVSVFTGGFSVQQIAFIENEKPPHAGAVDYYANRIIFGGAARNDVWALGYRDARLPQFAVQNIAESPLSGASPNITALKFYKQSIGDNPQFIIGASSSTADQLDSNHLPGQGNGFWQSRIFQIGQPFEIKRISFPLSAAIASGIQIQPSILVDNNSNSYSAGSKGIEILDTNFYGNSEGYIVQNLEGVVGNYDFSIKFLFNNTAECSVGLPIIIELETTDRISAKKIGA